MDVIKPGINSRATDTRRKAVSEIKKRRQIGDEDLPIYIDVERNGLINSIVPNHVWRTRRFKWSPQTFAAESEQLNSKFIEASVQDSGLTMFISDPRLPMIYGVSGNPDDSKAKYFAAYLIQIHLRRLKSDANVVWLSMYGGFETPYMGDDKAKPTMLVLTNLTPNSTAIKLEKTRDLLEKYADIPRIVVVAGLDPMSFLTTRLYVPINALAYMSEGLVKARIEVI